MRDDWRGRGAIVQERSIAAAALGLCQSFFEAFQEFEYGLVRYIDERAGDGRLYALSIGQILRGLNSLTDLLGPLGGIVGRVLRQCQQKLLIAVASNYADVG